MCLGHSISQALVLVQAPNPSSSIFATIAFARFAASILCGVCMAADLYASIPGGEKNVSGMEFTKAKEITEFTYTPTKDDLAGAKDSDILLVSFVAKAEKVATPVEVSLGDKASLTVTMYTTPHSERIQRVC